MSDASESTRRPDARTSAGGFAVALSGGGHRATLMTLGALLALVDRRLSGHVMQIASVSGGSITNAFVAQRCDFKQLNPGKLDPLAKELASIVVARGVVTRGWMIGLLGGPVVIAVGFGVLLSQLRVPAALSVGAGVVIAAGLLMMTGHVVEWLLDRRYFRVERDQATMSTLSGRAVDHVFSMTDLVLGQPVHVSSQQDGMVWRRLGMPSLFFQLPPIQICAAGSRSIAEIVRASAAFPGIPPRRMLFPADTGNPNVAATPRTAFLADGGLWNNLGSQVLREDRFIGSDVTRVDGRLCAPSLGSSAWTLPLLLVNGSAALRPSRTWPFVVPGMAQLTALLQGTRVLNTNTVGPRVTAMKQSFERRVGKGHRPDHYDPLDLVVDLSPPKVIQKEYNYGAWGEEQIQLTDEAVEKWEQGVLSRVRKQMKNDTGSDADRLHYLLQTPEPAGSYPVAGFAEIQGWDAVLRSDAWRAAVEVDGGAEIAVPTTLGRIDAEVARRLVARGYLNTFLVSLYLAPLGPDDLTWLGRLGQRLSAIVPSR